MGFGVTTVDKKTILGAETFYFCHFQNRNKIIEPLKCKT